ncbi:MAG: hypothetical protein ACRECF_08990 [Methyloceanibacter sp.]
MTIDAVCKDCRCNHGELRLCPLAMLVMLGCVSGFIGHGRAPFKHWLWQVAAERFPPFGRGAYSDRRTPERKASMDDALADVAIQIDALKGSINEQHELQKETNSTMRDLITTLMETAQAVADLRKELVSQRPA